MEIEKYRFILGSGSPRRKQMFDWMGINYEVIPPDVDEELNINDPKLFVKEVLKRKLDAVSEKIIKRQDKSSLILVSDTIVIFENEILGKPKDINDARVTLKRMRNQVHEVITGFALQLIEDGKKKKDLIQLESSLVKFWDFPDSVLEDYLSLKDSMDKAGSYGLQGPGMVLVESIKGSYSNVVGLPLNKVIESLTSVLEIKDPEWKNIFY